MSHGQRRRCSGEAGVTSLRFFPISFYIQLAEGDRLHLREKPACLSTRSEGERMGKEGFEMIEMAGNISFVI